MKVKCTKLVDSRGNFQEFSPWLTVGKVYLVLSVLLDINGKWLLRLLGDNGNGVALFSLSEFEIISAKIPATWIVAWNPKGVFELTTETWNQPGFWEKYYDRDPEAIKLFDTERSKIIDSDP
jgi:hypothetical protein